jgi:nucleotide-binding universal stress UspA family protein
LKNILVGIDLQETDHVLLQHAHALAEKFQSKVWLLHITNPDPDFVGYDIGPTYIRNVRAEELHQQHTLLQSLAKELAEDNIPATSLLLQGTTRDLLIEKVNKLNIDLLILGKRKHGILYELFIGHTAINIIEEIQIPILIIPLPDGK